MNSRSWKPVDAYSEEIGFEVSRRLEGSTLLITGGLGLLGLTSLGYVEYLKNTFGLNVDLTLTSRSDQGLPLAESFGSGFTFLTGDLAKPEFLAALPQYDFIMHAAGYGQPSKFLADPLSTLTINSLSTVELRRKAKEGYLFVSSSEVYSGVEHSLISENEIGTTGPAHARAPYIEAKRFGEAATLVHAGSGVEQGSVARLALAYGPGTRWADNRVMSELIVRGLTEKTIVLRDSGNRLRTYCYAEDAVEMLFGILAKSRGETFNVGGKSTTSIREMGSAIADRLGVGFSAQDIDLQIDSSPVNVSLDCSKVQMFLGKEKYTPLGKGLDETVAWYRELMARL